MIQVAVMIEGQDGLTWERWQAVAELVEAAGFVGLYRSDHYTNAQPPDKASLELWTSLTWLADNTERIEFGPLVSPVSFRHPSMTARMAAAVDDLSGGRLTLGVGAGWQEREHHLFGWDLLPVPERFDRFEEGLEVITRLLQDDEASTYEGDYFQLQGGVLLPRPQRPGGPPILVGGNGPNRTLPLTARFADEWNAVLIPLDEFRKLSLRLDRLLEEQGRRPEEVRRSMMTGCIYGETEQEVEQKVQQRSNGEKSAAEYRSSGLVVGTPDQVVEQLGAMAEAGLQRVMLQWLDWEDLAGLQSLADHVLPQVQ